MQVRPCKGNPKPPTPTQKHKSHVAQTAKVAMNKPKQELSKKIKIKRINQNKNCVKPSINEWV